jgi:uncharacterized protein YlzI (FlbEa/FlbD family)
MKKLNLHLLFCLWAMFCLSLFVSCDNDKDVPQDGLPGYWYCSDDSRIYCLMFSPNGTGQVTYHTYSDGQWNKWVLPLQYTLYDGLLTIKPEGGEIRTGVIGINGNSMSFTDGSSAIMFTRYNGSEKIINELKKEYEDSLEENVDTVIEGEFIITENSVRNVISSIYNHLCDYEYRQMLLEKIRLTQKDFYDRPMPGITPSTPHVANTWDTAYQIINMANLVINELNKIDMNERWRIAYINEAAALRCMVYYNLSQLWGHVPYITKSHNNRILHEAIQSSPILSQEELCPVLDDILQDISILPEDKYRITREAVKALRAEIALSLGHKEEARYLLQDCQANFYLLVDESSHPEIYYIFGEELPNYTPEKTALLLKEAYMETPEDTSAILTGWETQKLWWGYWTMLKRTGHAKAMAGCEDYELLMPIPQAEIDLMPSLPQNPGY